METSWKNDYDNKTLLIGIGNCGREDDGLGWTFIDSVKTGLPENYDWEYRYQLQIEDAELLSHYPTVYFIDAHNSRLQDAFTFEECHPEPGLTTFTHQMEPGNLLYLSKTIYDKCPKSHVLGITGCSFQMKIGLTAVAKENLKEALRFFNERVQNAKEQG